MEYYIYLFKLQISSLHLLLTYYEGNKWGKNQNKKGRKIAGKQVGLQPSSYVYKLEITPTTPTKPPNIYSI